MSKTLTAVFDGEVLRPESSLDLEPNARYVITINDIESDRMVFDEWRSASDKTLQEVWDNDEDAVYDRL